MTLFLAAAWWITAGLLTAALVSLASRYLEQQPLDKLELLLSFLFWPYFLVALIVRLNSGPW